MSKPLVAIVGRQNVGKSTLLNRIAGRPVSIIEDSPGTTRDRVNAEAEWQGREFELVDTGGIELEAQSSIARSVNKQVVTAINESDIVLFLVDVQAGLLPDDMEIANILRKTNKPVLLAVNKADNEVLAGQSAEFYRLGMGEPMPISAVHRRGTGDLLDKLTEMLPMVPTEPIGEDIIKLAIVGKPNVGKSSILNAILGRERVVVNEMAGTTRDATDTLFDVNGNRILLIDTAGIKRRGKMGDSIGRYSVTRSLRAIERSDVSLLVLDAGETISAQDNHVAGYIQQAGKGVILVVNKWDKATPLDDIKETTKNIKEQFRFLPYAGVLFVSAKSGQGIDRIIPEVIKVYKERSKRVATTVVNNVVQAAVAAHGPPPSKNKQPKLFYATQAEINPPTFVFFVNEPELVHFSYRRYLENKLRESFGFNGTPIRLTFKTRRAS